MTLWLIRVVFLLQQVLDIEQSMLLEAYTQFVSKVEQKPKESVEEAKKWLMGDLLQQGFQVHHDISKGDTSKEVLSFSLCIAFTDYILTLTCIGNRAWRNIALLEEVSLE